MFRLVISTKLGKYLWSRNSKLMNQLCWCGNPDLKEFSPGYLRCDACSTLVSKSFPTTDITVITDEASDFYGKKYWFDHQVAELGLSSIEQRSRSDLLDRCGLWLDQLLAFSLPPARVLEIGCSHGGFLALAELAGFRATGNELSEWVAGFARRSFGVKVLVGPIERLGIKVDSFDAVCMFDVLEHLQNPIRTFLACAQALSAEGVLVVQTPKYPTGMSYAALQESEHPFLKMMLPDEHLFLFSDESVTKLLSAAGFSDWEFLPAPFAHYDMMFAAGRTRLAKKSAQVISEALEVSPGGRMTQGFLSMARIHAVLEQESSYYKLLSSKQEEQISKLRSYLEQESAAAQGVILLREDEIRSLRGYLEQVPAAAKVRAEQEEEIRTLKGHLERVTGELNRERERTLVARLGEKLLGLGQRREK